MITKLRDSLRHTRQSLFSGFAGFFKKNQLDINILEDLENRLLISDIGVTTTELIINKLTTLASKQQLQDINSLTKLLEDELTKILIPCQGKDPILLRNSTNPHVILVVGVNGVGKTTTIGKIAKKMTSNGLSVILAAGDTFRAAAIEQLKIWGDSNKVTVISQHRGADPASVIYDAVQAGIARKVDVVIADTAGRLHNQKSLMNELKKIKRVMSRLDIQAPNETLLVIDANTGQNSLKQVQQFHEDIGLTGLVMTKLDGTAKGGIIFSIARQIKLPIRFLSIGERIDDLSEFDAQEFVRAILYEE